MCLRFLGEDLRVSVSYFFRNNILRVCILAHFLFLSLSPAVNLKNNKYWLKIFVF